MTSFCAFQSDAFQGNAFQICLGVTQGSPSYAPWFTTLASGIFPSDTTLITQDWRSGVIVTTDRLLLTDIDTRRVFSEESLAIQAFRFKNIHTYKTYPSDVLQTLPKLRTNTDTQALKSPTISVTSDVAVTGGSSRKRF